MTICRLILCEKSSHWAAALRSALAGQPPAVVETRSLSQAEAALAESPASVVAIEATAANLDAALALIHRARSQFHHVQFVGLLPSEAAPAAPLRREAGAIDVLTSVLDADRLARLARRQFVLAPPAGPLTIRELVADRLPWLAHATHI